MRHKETGQDGKVRQTWASSGTGDLPVTNLKGMVTLSSSSDMIAVLSGGGIDGGAATMGSGQRAVGNGQWAVDSRQ